MTPDSSVIVAAFASWNARHVDAVAAVRGLVDLVAHAELEAYSVMTRLPEPRRASGPFAAQYLSERYPGSRLSLQENERATLLNRLAEEEILGGAVYDALIALTARDHDRELLTLDRRAAGVYRRLDVRFVLV